jgi:hypothetical protein
VEEYTSPGRRTNADALPRLGAGYFSWRDAFGRSENKPYLTGSPPISTGLSPADLNSQPQTLKLPSRLYNQTVPKQRRLWSGAEYVKPARLDLN